MAYCLLLPKISHISRFRSMSDIPETSSARMAASKTNSRSTDQPNNEVVWEHLSLEEKLAAAESLSVYCKPVELYNYLRSRANEYSLHLRRCLDYKIKAKRKKRIIMTATLSWKDDEDWSLFPLCICLGRLDPNKGARRAQRYHVGRIFTFQGLSGIDGKGNTQLEVNFMLPEFDKLAAQFNSGEYCLLIFASAENPISLSRANAGSWPVEVASNESWGGEKCLYGKVYLNFLHDKWKLSPHFPLREPGNIRAGITLNPCILTYYLQYCFQRKSKIISIQDSRNSKGNLKQLEISFCAEEFGAWEKSQCQTDESREVASMSTSPSSSRIFWLKEGNVAFHYRYYYNKLHRTEVTENFSCPFCLVRCSTYKGLKCHLESSHEYFNFEFLKSEDCPTVSVSMKTAMWSLQRVDPRVQTFLYCAKRLRHREPKNASRGRTNDTDQLPIHAEIPTESKAIILHPGLDCVPSISDHNNGTHAMLQVDHEGASDAILHPGPDCVPLISDHDDGTHAMLQDDHEGVSNAILHPGLDCVPSISDHDNGTHEMLQDDHEGVSNAIILHPGPECVPSTSEVPQARKKDKLPIEQHDPNIVARYEKRQFYHSHKYQPMALEEVLVDEDSEDEMNEGAQEIEDRRKLAILDAPDHVKQFLPMWNAFIKKHRVLADGHMNWACEAFTKYHCAELAQSPSLAWCWRLFMIKLISHGLLKIPTFHACTVILEQYQKQNQDPKS